MLQKEILALLKKELRLEMRQKYALGGILLYVVSTIFVCYLSFTKIINIPTWNALFWIIMLFTATNAIAKSFSQESRGNQLYQYTLMSPQAAILAKIIYNAMLMVVLSGISLFFFTLFIGSEVLAEVNWGLFITALGLGSLGFACVLTMIAAIASKTNNNLGLMAILGFPLMLPLLLTVMRLSKQALDGFDWALGFKNLLILGLINVMITALSYILFPYLWRD